MVSRRAQSPVDGPVTRSWKPSPYASSDIYALQNLNRGIATAEQQQHALRFIIESLCWTYQPEFSPHDARESDHAAGKRFVGLQLVKLLNLSREMVALIADKEGARHRGQESNRDTKA